MSIVLPKVKSKKNHYDIIIIPNLIHHIEEHDNLIKKCNLFKKMEKSIFLMQF